MLCICDEVSYRHLGFEAIVSASGLQQSLPFDWADMARSTQRHMQHQIPKRIIQTGKCDLQPLRSRAVMSNIRALNPDYEYLFFDNARVEEFIECEFPVYRGVFQSFRFSIQRYDFFRYLAVYRYGGFYFDLDVLLARSLSDLLEHGCVFPFEALTLSHFMRKS